MVQWCYLISNLAKVDLDFGQIDPIEYSKQLSMIWVLLLRSFGLDLVVFKYSYCYTVDRSTILLGVLQILL